MSTALIAYTPVQVLNTTDELLGSTQLKRALALVANGRAEVTEEDASRRIRTVGGIDIPLPIAIRLLNWAGVYFEKRDVIFTPRGVLERDKYTCGYCRKHATTHDHILPKSRGGADSWLNAIAACTKCNNKKSNKTPKEARMPLLFEPFIPTKLYIVSINGSEKRRRKRKNK